MTGRAPIDTPSRSGADLAAQPRRRWSDGPNYAWNIGLEEEWGQGAHWPALVALLCEQVAQGTDRIERDLARVEGDGRLGPRESGDVRAAAQSMRSVGMALQQIVRLGSGAFTPQAETLDLGRVVRRIAHERLREFVRGGAEIGFAIEPCPVLVDAAVAERLVNVAIDWALSFAARARVKVDAGQGRSLRHLVVRAALPHAPMRAAAPARRERRMNDNLHWLLLRQLASFAQLPIRRSSTAATESVVIQFVPAPMSPGAISRLHGMGDSSY